MRHFFKAHRVKALKSFPDKLALEYGTWLWPLVEYFSEEQSEFRFNVGLSVDGSSQEFERITKRTILVSDTLLLSHAQAGACHSLEGADQMPLYPTSATFDGGPSEQMLVMAKAREYENTKRSIGMQCPDPAELGRWLLDVEPLLKAGLAWYLPSYTVQITHETIKGVTRPRFTMPKRVAPIDFLVRDGRAIDVSGVKPVKNQLVRPVLQVELPFIEAVSLQDFSKITVEEFASYSGFRDFLRQSFLDMDASMNAIQSDRELIKLGLQIKDQVRAVRAEMKAAHRKRAVAVTGATIGSISATLVAVYGPALAAAVATIGASGGLWGIINAAADNNIRTLQENKWHYVWMLAKESNADIN